MDNRNRFLTPSTYLLLRLEYWAALLICIALAALHAGEIRWWVFALLFLYIDVIGYLPGAIAYRRAPKRPIGKHYYVLYNSMHSLLSGALVAGLWAWLVKPEWALLAIPIHLCGDRALFGNFLKSFKVAFEPEAHPAFQAFEQQLSRPEPLK